MSKAPSFYTLLSSQNNFKILIEGHEVHNLHSSANFIPCSTNLSPFIGTPVFKASEKERLYIHQKEKGVSVQAVSQTR